MSEPNFFQLQAPGDEALVAEAAAGLAEAQAQVSPKFLYDRLGAKLFEAITELPEYYPTRTEAAIFAAHGSPICQAALRACGEQPVLVDLGAGNCAKAEVLFAALRPRRYVAVDIAAAPLREALGRLRHRHPAVELFGVGLDFSSRLRLPADLVPGPALVFYPGSSIGNFTPEAAARLLRDAREVAAGGALLIGVDLVKPVDLLQAAYDDALGVTAAFDLNLLNHLNRLLGADFDIRGWRHLARFDAAHSRIEMHLEARAATHVRWRGGARRFAAGERIHTENAYKWSVEDFAALLRAAGFRESRCWRDDRGWFAVFLATG